MPRAPCSWWAKSHWMSIVGRAWIPRTLRKRSVQGVPRDCVRTTQCASDSEPMGCLCGLIGLERCSTSTLEQVPGECKDVIAQAAETNSTLDISTRFGDPAYALGLAFRLIQCDQRFCPTRCSF